jgi:U3 small nucleolar RNA-associated protein 14
MCYENPIENNSFFFLNSFKSSIEIMSNSKKRGAAHDVYSDSEDDESRKPINPRMDRVENFEYDLDKVISDDEEIDESEAFNTDDDQKYSEAFQDSSSQVFPNFLTLKSRKRKTTVTSDNILEDSASEDSQDEDDSEDDGEMMDISDMLNNNDDEVVKKGKVVPDFARTYESEEEESHHQEFNSSDESEGEDTGDVGLEDLVQGLSKSGGSGRKSRKRGLAELTEAFEESEYNVNSRESSDMKKKVRLEELIGSLGDETAFGGLKKKIVKLDVSDRKTGLGETVAVPLHKRAHDKLNREAAYNEAKNQVKKWVNVVQTNRKADTLKFTGPDVSKTTNNSLVSKFKVSF